MAKEQGTIKTKRIEIPLFEGVNAFVASNISKKQEPLHVENARSSTIGTIEKRQGTRRLGNAITATANYGIFYFDDDNASSNGFYRISTVSATTTVYYQNTSAVWTALTGGGTSLVAPTAPKPLLFSSTIAEECCFLVNDANANRYIKADGLTVVTSATAASAHLYNSPNANKINYYKDKLYLADYTISSTRYKTGITFSSEPLGICALVDGDHTATITSLKVTDVKYIHSSDTLEIYRGGSRITGTTDGDATSQFDVADQGSDTWRYTWDGTGTDPDVDAHIAVGTRLLIAGFTAVNNGAFTVTGVSTDYFEVTNASGTAQANITSVTLTIRTITVTSKTEDTLTINSFETDIQSADELWVVDTRTGTKYFRWADNPESGVNVKQYDTFKLTSNQNDRIKMMTNIGDVMMIGTNNNLSVWNGYNLKANDIGVGCVSDMGYVKLLGTLFFIHYSGIYQTHGEDMPKLISAKVEPYITGATKANLEKCAMGKKGLSILASIGDVTLYHPDGSINKVLSDVCLEKDLKKDNWYVHTGITATQFATFPSSSSADRLEYSSTDTGYHVFELFRGEVDDKVTSDKEIAMRVDMNNITLSKQFEKICYPMEVIIEAERGSGIKCFISLDNDSFYEIEGEAIKGCTVLKVTNKDANIEKPPRCRQIRVSIRDFTKKLCKISRVAIIYSDTQEEENKKPEVYG